ncbi:LysR substrate-binding domain-containing protein [Rhizobium tumorigenes]|uniref:HTH-type transcriptional regulator TtuA n=1 Tax=Rhizobium tumorigenes TaxID=2041385 RepID=A0AAF1K9T4_9HYPH|nr:LysR substrate-binding domain-containing protein [Rhizobium tumorigenes]WFR95372.1 LysR substrate-binding domain-containing protein [Rhizobium tumorigenes]
MRKLPALSAMKVFEVVGQTRSFTKAAARLNLTQSAVSRQVRNLEDQLGEPLLIRRHHDLELTPAGVALFSTLQHAFHSVELAVRGIVDKSARNRLRINVPPTFAKRWLMPRMGRLRAALPDVGISIGTELRDSLAERSLLDCAIRFGDGEWPMLNAHLLMTERHIAVCAPTLLGGRRDTSPMDFSDLTFLHVLASADRRYMTWQHWLDAAGLADIDTSGGLEFDLLDLVIEAACNGLGVAVVDRFMVDEYLADGRLVQLSDVEIEGHESYWLVERAGVAGGNHLKAFRQWLFDELSLTGAGL